MPDDQKPIVSKEEYISKTKICLVAFQSYFITIATILGTGVLGLPVTMSDSGFYPFLLTFVISFILQVAVVIVFVELLQKSYIHGVKMFAHDTGRKIHGKGSKDDIPLEDIVNQEAILEADPDPGDQAFTPYPNLISMAKDYLARGLAEVFCIIVVVQFIFMCITYALAGSEAWGEVLKIQYTKIIPIFTWVLVFIIIFIWRFLIKIVTVLTLVKGTVLIVTIGVTSVLASYGNTNIKTDFRYFGDPMLMGTVSLGGVMSVMPMMFSFVPFAEKTVRIYRGGVIGGLSTCFLLNVAWCLSVLKVVPQRCEGLPENGECISLENSAAAGEISTVPLAKMILTQYSDYSWIAKCVQLFIVVSITVSFLTMGGALHHTLSGWVDGLFSKHHQNPVAAALCPHAATPCRRHMTEVGVSLVPFSCVFIVAIMNPQGFVTILDKVVSLLLNTLTGLFFFLMVQAARKNENFSEVTVPLETPALYRWFHFPVFIYFTFAVFYDIGSVLYKVSTGKEFAF